MFRREGRISDGAWGSTPASADGENLVRLRYPRQMRYMNLL
jgi:hypothetical protein